MVPKLSGTESSCNTPDAGVFRAVDRLMRKGRGIVPAAPASPVPFVGGISPRAHHSMGGRFESPPLNVRINSPRRNVGAPTGLAVTAAALMACAFLCKCNRALAATAVTPFMPGDPPPAPPGGNVVGGNVVGGNVVGGIVTGGVVTGGVVTGGVVTGGVTGGVVTGGAVTGGIVTGGVVTGGVVTGGVVTGGVTAGLFADPPPAAPGGFDGGAVIGGVTGGVTTGVMGKVAMLTEPLP